MEPATLEYVYSSDPIEFLQCLIILNEASRRMHSIQRSAYAIHEVSENQFASAPSPKVLECE